ncbi:MAG: diacylglycerol kinase family lipid kinase [Alistipes sp.]|nr:diacylglycerol kinase family lipid kinase [Candidatus Minthomonas equi]
MEKWYVIVNPKAGGGKVEEDWSIIRRELIAHGVLFDAVFTEHRYHAIELTISGIRQGYRKFISIGGDGTLHELVNGIFLQKEVPSSEFTIGVISAGTGNDWIRMHGDISDRQKNIEAILKGQTIRQDIVKVTYTESCVQGIRYMVNIGGIGYDSNVCQRCNNLKLAGRRGPMVYINSAIKSLIGRTFTHSVITVDGKQFFQGKYFSIGLGNGRFCGGGMIQTPDAEIDDGLLNITVIKKVSKLRVVLHLKDLFKGTIYNIDGVIHTTGKKITVSTSSPDRVEVDGEVVGETPVTFEILPQALKVIVSK